jgi:hypothetical protein
MLCVVVIAASARWSLSNLGVVLIEAGCSEAAERTYRDALHLDPQDPTCHANLGVILLRQGRDGDAREVFERALALDPNAATARENLDLLNAKAREPSPRETFGGASAGVDKFTTACVVEITHPRGTDYPLQVGETLTVEVVARTAPFRDPVAELCIVVWAGGGSGDDAAMGTLCTRDDIRYSQEWGPLPTVSKASFQVGISSQNTYRIAAWATPAPGLLGTCSHPVGVLVSPAPA